MQCRHLDFQTSRRLWPVLLIPILAGTLAHEPQASAREADLESRGANSYEIAKDGDAAVVPVIVYGRLRLFILDTGSRITALDNSFRPLLGESVDVKTGRLSNGAIKLELFPAPSIRVKGQDTTVPDGTPKLVTIADLSMLREWTGYNIEGILGMDFLQHTMVCIDPDQGLVTFGGTVQVGAGTAIPLRYWRGKLPTIEVVAGGERVQALLDTGSLGSRDGNLDYDIFSRLARVGRITNEQSASIGTLAGESETRSGTLRDLGAGPFLHHDLHFDSSNISSLGMLYLSRYVVTFDFPRDTLYFKKSRLYAEPYRWDLSGMSFKRIGKRTVLDSVEPDSPAESAGLQAGDVIVRIGAMGAEEERLHTLRLALSTEGRVNVVVRRGGTEISVRLDLRKHQETSR